MGMHWLYVLTVFVFPPLVACLLVVLTLLLVKYHRQAQRMKSYSELLLLDQIRALYKDIIFESVDRSKLASKAAKKRRRVTTHGKKPNRQSSTVVLNDHVTIVPEDLRIRFEQLDMGRVLGQGAFGRVYQAVLNDPWLEGEQSTVAVKTVQDKGDPRKIIKFLQEGLIMKTFDHPNVLGLLGLTFDPAGQPLIVIPFMENGDLRTFLVKQKQKITHPLLIQFAYQVALGMEYLARQRFVHRDLAARNCMVDDQLVAKIADFGLSRDLEESDYYTSGDKQAKLPLKWMAPESMERMVYNSKTDVWSYGVLLWELFSRGKKPYPDLRNRDVYTFLKEGKRMNPPKFCPKKISEIMQECWKDSSKRRCSFRQIVENLEDLMASEPCGSSSVALPGRPHPLHAADNLPTGAAECTDDNGDDGHAPGPQHTYVNLAAQINDEEPAASAAIARNFEKVPPVEGCQGRDLGSCAIPKESTRKWEKGNSYTCEDAIIAPLN
ncbi:hepatocyte growth factor receptor-like [Acanthaster planci]|uniref:Hepatocyte growth factor receptor-like n=1 Tax=Acanthaster planci TaxID=133434 RepID=A0A8B7XJT9_ACAPL|nr:hepatocyte growth factor receptor-like [Acanthaster planci]XP_022081064.1 hepatocyte growth factor receptor-like [Acanthaster planci]